MTSEEFARYCLDGEQWTRATLAAVRLAQDGWLPTGTIEEYERELNRPDGVIQVRRMEPLFTFRERPAVRR